MKRALTLVELVVAVGIVLILLALVTSSFSSIIARAEAQKTQTAMALLDAAVTAYEEGTGRQLLLSPQSSASVSPNVEFAPDPLSEAQIRRGVQPYAMHRNGLHLLTTAELTRQLLQYQDSAEILAKIDPSMIYKISGDVNNTPFRLPSFNDFACEPDLNKLFAQTRFGQVNLFCTLSQNPYCLFGSLLILDAWGQPIRAIHPGPPLGQGPESQDSGLDRLMTQPDGTVVQDKDGTVARLAEYQYFDTQIPDARIRMVSSGPDLKFGKRVLGPDGSPEGPECFQFSLDNIIFGGSQ